MVSDGGVPAAGVVEAFDELEDGEPGSGSVREGHPVEEFGLEGSEERLGDCVDAPIVKYLVLGGGNGGLSGSVIGHDALVDLACEEPFEAADDVFLVRPSAVRRAT